jgi:hypothetical protein
MFPSVRPENRSVWEIRMQEALRLAQTQKSKAAGADGV